MTRVMLTLANDRIRERAIEFIRRAVDDSRVELKGPQRSTKQNRAMWPMLDDLSTQLTWYGQQLDQEEWKLVMLDALRREHRDQLKIVPNIDKTGFVDISGKSSSDLSEEEMRDLLTIIRAFGDQHGVVWTEPKKKPLDDRPAPPVEAYEDVR